MQLTHFQNEFRDYPTLLRQAISLGRRMQDPLVEFAQLCTPDEEILCLRFHSYQVENLIFVEKQFVNPYFSGPTG